MKVTKENLKVFSGQRSKILSIATHSFKPEDIRYYSPSFLLLHPDKTKGRSMQLTAKG